MITIPKISRLHQTHFIKDSTYIDAWCNQGIAHGFQGIGDDPQDYHSCQQVHGIDVIEASSQTSPQTADRPAADGILTQSEDLKIAVVTADCVPVLLYSPHQVAAVHAGWRGLFAGIIGQAIQQFSDPSQLQIGIGPAISQHSFEVGRELVNELMKVVSDTDILTWVLSPGVGDRWHIDLGLLAVFLAIEQGVPADNIYCMRTCTKLAVGRWHSYRRDGGGSGRNWSWISRSAG